VTISRAKDEDVATGNTPMRAMRIADDVWIAAQKRAAEEGTTVTAVVVAALKRYGQPPKPKAPRKP
jgi:hypothetical protein